MSDDDHDSASKRRLALACASGTTFSIGNEHLKPNKLEVEIVFAELDRILNENHMFD